MYVNNIIKNTFYILQTSRSKFRNERHSELKLNPQEYHMCKTEHENRPNSTVLCLYTRSRCILPALFFQSCAKSL